jgi:hypothetical protein
MSRFIPKAANIYPTILRQRLTGKKCSRRGISSAQEKRVSWISLFSFLSPRILIPGPAGTANRFLHYVMAQVCSRNRFFKLATHTHCIHSTARTSNWIEAFGLRPILFGIPLTFQYTKLFSLVGLI